MPVPPIPFRYPIALAAFPPSLGDRLWPDARVLHVRPGTAIVSTGAEAADVYVLLEGRARVALFSAQGREVILRDLAPGALFGELAALDDQPRSSSVTAVGACVLACIAAARFAVAIDGTPGAGLWLARRLAGQVRLLTDTVFELNALAVRHRLHCELLRLALDAGRDGNRATIDPAPTHAELASRIGTHREAVTREMGYLASRNVLTQDRRRLAIDDLAELTALVRAALGTGDTHRLIRQA